VVLRPTRHKISHFGDVSASQSLGLVWKKLNLAQQKHAFTNQKKYTTKQNIRKKLKPGLVAFYEIWPGNGAGLFSKEKISKGREGRILCQQANNIYSAEIKTSNQWRITGARTRREAK